MFGVSRDVFLQHGVFDGVHPDDMPHLEILFSKAMAGERLPNDPLQFRFVKMDGTGDVIDLELKGETIEYEGKPAVLVLTRDITDEKKTLNLLKESEARYRLFTENIVDGITVGRANPFKYLYANKAMETITGYNRC